MKYPNIDMVKTGIRLQNLVKQSGYTVREMQEYLHLSCPQPIYRWFKGQMLPSLNHVYALSKLLRVNMEDILVEKLEHMDIVYEAVYGQEEKYKQRFLRYYEVFRRVG